MMGIGPEEAGRLNMWTYEAVMWNWNQAHGPKQPSLTHEGRKRLERAMEAHLH